MRKAIIALLLIVFAMPTYANGLTDFFNGITGHSAAISIHRHPSKIKYTHARKVVQPSGGTANIHALVNEIAAAHHLRPSLVHAVIKIESGYNCGARNHEAHGIMQVKTATASSVGVHGNLYDCRTGLEAGVRYLRQSISQYGEGCVAYSAYNSGLGSHSCTGYGRRVQRLASR